MAEAFVKMQHDKSVEAFSAGSKPSGKINLKAVTAMNELDYDLSKHQSKSLEEIKQFAPFDAVVTMGCGDACPWMPAKNFIDWEIPDPKEMDEDNFRKVRTLIKTKVIDLLASL
jgi:arsenate reductase